MTRQYIFSFFLAVFVAVFGLAYLVSELFNIPMFAVFFFGFVLIVIAYVLLMSAFSYLFLPSVKLVRMFDFFRV